MNCLIVDDQEVFRVILAKMLALDESLTLIGEYSNAIEAHRKIQNHQIDILFLDIQMPGMSGLELAKILEGKRPMIIFTTARTEYAIDAFNLNVADFLTKPFSPARFLKAIAKAKDLIKITDLTINDREEQFVFIRDSNIIRRLNVNDILYLEAQGDYVRIFLPNQTYSIHSSLKSVEEKLPRDIFLRVHRSFIINLSKVDTIEGGTIIINKMMVPVSDAYRAILNKRLQIL